MVVAASSSPSSASPRHVGRLRRWGTGIGLASLLGATAGLSAAPSASGAATEPTLSGAADQSIWSTNGRVMDIVSLGDKALIGGGFDYVGPTTGHVVSVDSTSGVRTSPKYLVSGDVHVTLADGSGGYYVGGDFPQVGGVNKRSLAHILADGTVDRGFDPNPSGTVEALAMVGGRLVVGGLFTSMGGATVSNLAAVDPVSGAAVPGWSASTNGQVLVLRSAGSGVYVGGTFTTVGGGARRNLARLVPASGAVDTSFTGTTDGTVRTLEFSGDGSIVYAGGDFAAASSRFVGSAGRARLAAFGIGAGDVQSWNPGANAGVRVITRQASTGLLLVGGLFTTLGGQPRVALGGLTEAGVVDAFDAGMAGGRCPHGVKDVYSLPICVTEVDAISSEGGVLRIGGVFGSVLGVTRHNAAALDEATNSLTAWDPVVGSALLSITPTASGIVLGGSFTSVGGILRQGTALIDLTTGEADQSFRADVDQMVVDLELTPDGSSVYLSGDFKTLNGVSRNKIARVSVATGDPDGFRLSPNNTVIKAVANGDNVYLSGKFTKLGSVVRQHAARVSAATAAVDPGWVANTTGPSGNLRYGGAVQGMAVAPDGSKVYLAGPFTAVNGTPITGGIIVVSGSNGTLDPRRLGGVQTCTRVGPWINRLYLSPDGSSLYGGDVCPDYIYKWDAVNLSTPSNPTGLLWRTWCNMGMQGALDVNGHFYYGSHGGNRGKGGACWASPSGTNVERQRFAAFDSASGALLNYAPDFDMPMGVWSFATNPRCLLVGGDFTMAGTRQTVQQGFALFRGTP